MLNAAMMGAVAFQKGLGVTHSLAHALSTVCDLHHGLANGICIPYAMAFNADVVPQRLAALGPAVGAQPASGAGFLSWLDELQRRHRHPGAPWPRWASARAAPAAGGDRRRRRLPPQQPQAGQREGLPRPVQRRPDRQPARGRVAAITAPRPSVGQAPPMTIEIGEVAALYRYPVKSMAGARADEVELGLKGVEGDRRLAFRRTQERGGFPWLSAGKLPELVLYTPLPAEGGQLPTRVRAPDGRVLDLHGEELAAEIGRLHGAQVQMMRIDAGTFDEASVSVVSEDTVAEVARASHTEVDVRRFRPNILLRLRRPGPYQEDAWVGGVLIFGDGPSVGVTMRDPRCSMLNLDPDSARATPEVLRAVVRANHNDAGVYGTVMRTGRLAVGQPVRLQHLDGR